MKGAGIQKYYYTFDMSQGQIEHLKEKEYLKKCGNSEKAHHHETERIVMQGMTGANDKIRLVMAIVPKGLYLGHSIHLTIRRHFHEKFVGFHELQTGKFLF